MATTKQQAVIELREKIKRAEAFIRCRDYTRIHSGVGDMLRSHSEFSLADGLFDYLKSHSDVYESVIEIAKHRLHDLEQEAVTEAVNFLRSVNLPDQANK